MRPIDELTKTRPPARPVHAIGALASQHEVRQLVPPAVGISATVEWARTFAPAELVIPLRTGLPAWIGHQGLWRRWPLRIVAARDTLTRAGDDVLPILLELWLGAEEQIIVDNPVQRDQTVRDMVPIATIEDIVGRRVPTLGTVVA